MASATIQVSSGFQTGDQLNFTTQNGITGLYNATGRLALSGSASLANYQAALRSITFATTNANPGTTRTVSFTVNDGAADSNLLPQSLTIVPVNDPPVLASGLAAFAVNEGATKTITNTCLKVTDPDSTAAQGG